MIPTSPKVVFLSGALSPDSCTTRIAHWCAGWCVEQGAETTVFAGRALDFPPYHPQGTSGRSDGQRRYLDALRSSDGVVLLSPAYHGTVSGLLKNALDYVTDLARERRPLLDGRVIGCVAVSPGEQSATTTLLTLRTVGHALRGWPTPVGVTLPCARAVLDADGQPVDVGVRSRLQTMLGQVLSQASAASIVAAHMRVEEL